MTVDALSHTQVSGDRASLLNLLAGPEPGRTSLLVEHEVLVAKWESLNASSQALDELAVEHPTDLARRHHARAQRFAQRATGIEESARPDTILGATRLRH